MGVYLYDCPIDWLDKTVPFNWGRMADAWRAGVREYHKHCDMAAATSKLQTPPVELRIKSPATSTNANGWRASTRR